MCIHSHIINIKKRWNAKCKCVFSTNLTIPLVEWSVVVVGVGASMTPEKPADHNRKGLDKTKNHDDLGKHHSETQNIRTLN